MSKINSYSNKLKTFLGQKTLQEFGVNTKGKEKYDQSCISYFIRALGIFFKPKDGFLFVEKVTCELLDAYAYAFIKFLQIEPEIIEIKTKSSMKIKYDSSYFKDITFPNEDCEKCNSLFLRTAFIICGTILDPVKGYHLSFSHRNKEIIYQIRDTIFFFGIEGKISLIDGKYTLYFKDSGVIEDLLSIIGAQKFSLELIDTKIEKSIRNDINRRQNFDDANIKKSVDNAQKVIQDINYLKKIRVLSNLNDKIKTAAKLRVLYPEKSIRELCELSNVPITKSGLNHRLTKISEIANEYRGKNE